LLLALGGAALAVIVAICVRGYEKERWKGWQPLYLSTATALALFFVAVAQMTTEVSVERGSKSLAKVAAPFIAPEDRLVFYDTYLPGIPFYLSANKPSWIVQREGREEILGSNYLGERRPDAAANHGRVVFSFGEFAQLWNRNDLALRVIVKEKNLRRLASNVGATPKLLTRFDEYLLVTNR
jgi:hypothetical protein